MQTIDWSTFSLRIPVKGDRDVLYRMWSTRQGIESWFLREAIFTGPGGTVRGINEPVRKDDRYEWRWHGWPDDVVERGTILEANGTDAFRFTFGKGGNVSVRISNE
ncbi:MAG TPA: hypothetical protein VFZ78_11205, partial [Flavisolibacter sp.]